MQIALQMILSPLRGYVRDDARHLGLAPQANNWRPFGA